MPESLENFAVPLDTSADALSDVLEMIHLRGDRVTRVAAGRGHEERHRAGGRLLHVVESGSVALRYDVPDGGGERVVLGTGDLALLARGVAHRLRPMEDAVWMSGSFVVEERAGVPLLEALPPAIVIRAEGREWLPLSAQLLGREVTDPSAGSKVMASRILDLLFIQALRAWAATDGASGPGGPGWLTAALDRPLGPALRAMHRQPEQPWTVESLAELSALSRAAFSARFTRLVGESPGRYLQRLRLAQAADLLTSTPDSAAAISRAVGYASEAAFSRAFAKEYGVGPRAWRSAGR
ncbi:AraC-like DNA-binding protein [Nocardioides aromaticivorans]|uniref:AraC-like DNA-binding protein n=1 Tax=Nocardioides aromaticivorans TaxID=200618 RepID=A0A7Z0CQF2_9ACTN|nr:AraC family transcriptional regulator [Nocardioides aromaticivorans]NYI47278.1 AraC-like DNA-binding protein [Nocardioides aromaticivorans]